MIQLIHTDKTNEQEEYPLDDITESCRRWNGGNIRIWGMDLRGQPERVREKFVF